MIYLKEATASQTLQLGPFVDDTDGKTAETGLTIANTDIKLCINGAAQVSKNSGGATHSAGGYYLATFDATDTATVGRLQITVNVAGALPVKLDCFVLDAATYDAFVTGLFPANVTQISGDATAADNLEKACDGTGYNVGAGDITTTSTGTVLALDGDALDSIADGVWDEAISGHVAAGSVGNVLNDVTQVYSWLSVIADPDTGTLDAIGDKIDVVDGIVDTLLTRIVGTLAAGTHNPQSGDAFTRLGAPSGASVSADIAAVKLDTGTVLTDTNELQTDLTDGGRLDLLIDAVKAKTDNLPSDPADQSAIEAILGTPAGASLSADVAAAKSDTTAILADTNELQTDWANGGRLDLILDAAKSDTTAILADTGTDGVVVADKTGFSLSTAGVDAILDEVIEGSYTMRQLLRGIVAVLLGKLSGAATTTVSIRDTGDSKNRVVATVDADGNRSDVTLDLT